MKTIEIKQHGGPDQLSEAIVPKPEANPGQIVVRVAADPLDVKIASGQMPVIFGER